MEAITFIADVHLGRLAKWLRMLGFDTLYTNDATATSLVHSAKADSRVLLSRNPAYHKLPEISFLQIAEEDSALQLKQVVEAFGLSKQFKPFTRCLVCNGMLEATDKKDIASHLEENTRRYYEDFWRCMNCNRVYWEGPHYEKMKKLLKELES